MLIGSRQPLCAAGADASDALDKPVPRRAAKAEHPTTMSYRPRKPRTPSSGLPPLVLGLLAVETTAVVVLLIMGVSPAQILRSAGPVVALTLAMLNQMFQDLGRRKPKLEVRASEAGADGVIEASARPPWPVDVERIVANELAAARETLDWRHGALMEMRLRVSDPFAVRPSEADHAHTRELFEHERLPEYEAVVRQWLSDYAAAATAHSQTFEVTLRLTSAAGGAHADDVRVEVYIPPTVKIVKLRPTLGLPPERPAYEPPKPRSSRQDWGRATAPVTPFTRAVPTLTLPALAPPAPRWKVSSDGRRLEASVGDVHAGRVVEVGEALLLHAEGSGSHEIRWTAFTKSARRPTTGTITLEVPCQTSRPAFGRLHGVVSYPDVPLVDGEGEVVHPVRQSDPLPRPAPAGDIEDILEVLQQPSVVWEWEALGLDPATDGPARSVVVREGRPVADGEDGSGS
jgi:hypothetical protein